MDAVKDEIADVMGYARNWGVLDILGAGLNVEISGLLTFAEFFFDGLLTDVIVQLRIKEAQAKINNAICREDNILTRLCAEQAGA